MLTSIDEIKESLCLKFLAMKSRRSSTDFSGRSSAFGVSRLVLFASEDGDSTIGTAPCLLLVFHIWNCSNCLLQRRVIPIFGAVRLDSTEKQLLIKTCQIVKADSRPADPSKRHFHSYNRLRFVRLCLVSPGPLLKETDHLYGLLRSA